ncbi:MAG: LysM peptidoglycan-binding domain-containing M23 family metallopeptidase [Croceibacterium sp.]
MKCLAIALAAVLLIAAGDLRTESEHTVAAGETLATIARRAGVPLSVIAQANGMSEGIRLRAGQKVAIPRQQTHTVRPGETSFAIAYRYGVTWDAIATANTLDQRAMLKPGQRLIIPAVLPPATAPVVAQPWSAPPVSEPPRFQSPSAGAILRADRAGIDYAAAVGDRISAAAAGTVIFAGDEPVRFGKLVVIDHGDGWHTAYGYLDRTTVKRGDSVRAGERIGFAGRKSETARAQLHFEIRRGDRPVDPAPLLAR